MGKEAEFLCPQREEVSGTSPFGVSDEDLSWSLSEGSGPPPIGEEVPSLLPSGDVPGLSSEKVDLSSGLSPDRGEAPRSPSLGIARNPETLVPSDMTMTQQFPLTRASRVCMTSKKGHLYIP